MSLNPKVIKALGLCSGGLDSILAALVLRSQGVEVEWVSFETPFFSSEKAKKAAKITKIPMTVHNITKRYLQMLKNPNCGYGKNMNPCMDCHALMFSIAGETMRERGFQFLFSGEVLGQRPMSQTRSSLKYVEKHSGMSGYILRPLSAKKLDATIPEQNGWVDRSLLLDIAGRGRKRQIQLAEDFGVKEYPAPAGGCLLTDKGYSRRLKDLLNHQDDVAERELKLLKYGRHFRAATGAKIIVGRTELDNRNILRLCDETKDVILRAAYYPSPIVLIPDSADRGEKLLAAAICAGYSKAPSASAADISVKGPGGKETMTVLPIAPFDVRHLMI
jgi:tRNA U34 2-thiouridine synthase MnmA/TrmU